MEPKHYVFIVACFVLLVAGTALARSRPAVRDWLFGIGVLITTDPGAYDVNLMGRELYRAATRGIEISMLDVIAAILIFSAPARHRRGWPASFGVMSLYTGYAALTIPFNEPQLFGYFEMSKLLRGLLVFTAAARYMRGPRELKILVISLCVTMMFESSIALRDRYIYGQNRIHGTMGSWNMLAMYSNIVAPYMLAAAMADWPKRLRQACALAFAMCGGCVILTISRTGFAVFLLMGIFTTLACVNFKITMRKVAIASVVLLLAAGALYKARDSLASRYEASSLAQEAEAERGRGLYFRLGALVVDDHPFGIGLNNWSYIVTNHYYELVGLPFRPYENTDVDFTGYTRNESAHMVAPPAHNLWILTAGEVGIPGLLLFIGIWYRWFRLAGQFVRKTATSPVWRFGTGAFFSLFGLVLSCMTEYGFRHSPLYFLTHILMGSLAGLHAYRQRLTAQARREARQRRSSAGGVAAPRPRQPSLSPTPAR
jgi:hypothetical protein